MQKGPILSVAMPVPLFKCFDYLPLENSEPRDYQVGMRVIAPFGHRQLVGTIVGIKHASDTPPNKLRAIDSIFEEPPVLTSAILELCQWAAFYYCHPIGECIQAALPKAARSRELLPETKTTRWFRTSKPFEGARSAKQQKRILEFIASNANGVLRESLRLVNATSKQLEILEQKQYLEKASEDVFKTPDMKRPASQAKELNAEQQQVSKEILAHKGFHAHLLQGVTGSGKTEVYINLAKTALANKKQVLILVPEINLTPQTFARFQSGLACTIAPIHSGLSSKEKFTSWHMAKNNHAQVIIGTRSAIFTPFHSIGLIIVDEEHDSSYKQSDGFKYSARDLAVKRAQLEDCPVVLGTATPSLESLHNASSGNYQWHKINQRAGGGELPEIKLIDVRSRPLSNGCSPPLLHSIRRELNEGNQVIVFQNRRGFAPTLLCESCSAFVQCKHCDSRMTLHSQPPHLHCHHCDYKCAIPRNCTECGGVHMSPLGVGTERIEIGLQQAFPDTHVIRIDRDVIKSAKHMEKAIEQINSGQAAIIIGTQMLSKGHDFHNVTLVAILDADGLFFSSDFRAIERGAQLLMQISGRTGRGQKAGQVLIQTRLPEHPFFDHVRNHDYEGCALEQLRERKETELPPASKMISLRADAEKPEDAMSCLEKIRKETENLTSGMQAIQTIGPVEASMPRRKGLYRCYLTWITTHNSQRSGLQRILPALISSTNAKTARLSIDVDPLEYL